MGESSGEPDAAQPVKKGRFEGSVITGTNSKSAPSRQSAGTDHAHGRVSEVATEVQPRFLYMKPEQVGIVISDSSMRAIVESVEAKAGGTTCTLSADGPEPSAIFKNMDYFEVTISGVKEMLQPRFLYPKPEQVGIVIDSKAVLTTCTLSADGPESESEQDRQVKVYGAAVCLPGKVSTVALVGFWNDHACMENQCEVFFVPPNDRLQYNLGPFQAKSFYSFLDPLVAEGKAFMVSTVKQAITEVGMEWNTAFRDAFHMWNCAQVAVNREYWRQIGRDQRRRRTTHKLAILIWDFNPSKPKSKNDWSDHKQFWRNFCDWATAEDWANKSEKRRALARCLGNGVHPNADAVVTICGHARGEGEIVSNRQFTR